MIKVKGYQDCIIYLLSFLIFYMIWSIFQSYNDITSETQMKHILVWNENQFLRHLYEQYPISKLQCQPNNCILTKKKYYLHEDYRYFDAIIFSFPPHPYPYNLPTLDVPEYRSEYQIYIYFTIESAFNVPACELYFDDFFNWTFTSRLDSDVVWKYFVVQNMTGHEIAPSINVNWELSAEPISSKIKRNWNYRTKAAAWLVSNCDSDNFRHVYVTKLQENLLHFSLKIDVYGHCNDIECPNDDCDSMLSKEYYFYLAFENSFSDDYVTEKVLHGYNNYVVPIVFGTSNYTR